MASGYADLKNELVSAANGVAYAYRDTGGGGAGAAPLVLLQHFRGNLDSWDPALVDALSSTRRVVGFDNAGVGGSTGTTPDTIEQMARDAIEFIAAMGFSQADILGVHVAHKPLASLAFEKILEISAYMETYGYPGGPEFPLRPEFPR
jgi:hypothetical protein